MRRHPTSSYKLPAGQRPTPVDPQETRDDPSTSDNQRPKINARARERPPTFPNNQQQFFTIAKC